MNRFAIYNETTKKIPGILELKKLIRYTLKKEEVDKAVFNIIFVDNDYIKKINKEYRGKDNITDVISFALEDNFEFKFKNYRILGDVYISIEKAITQAIEYNHSLKREISFLTIHGLLHLLGYDHNNKALEKIMFEKQELILNDFNIKR